MAYNFGDLPDVLQRSLKGKIYPGVSQSSALKDIRRTINNYNSVNNTSYGIPSVQDAFDWRGVSYEADMQKAAEYNRANLPSNHVVNQYGGSPTASKATADFSVSPALGSSLRDQVANHADWMAGMTDADRIRAAMLGAASPMTQPEWDRWKGAEQSVFAGAPTHTAGDVNINPRNQWALQPSGGLLAGGSNQTHQPGPSTSPQPGPVQSPQPNFQPSPQPQPGNIIGGGVPNTFNDYFEGDAYGVYGPPPSASTGGQQGGNFGTMGGTGYGPNPLGTGGPGGSVWQTWQPQTGLFGPNPNLPGGYEAQMFQDFNAMPHISNPRAPEVGLGGSWLNAGETMRIPSNLMGNTPNMFGALNNQTQWGGYWGPELTGLVGPHGIAPGYGFYNSNSPVNYSGLFAQSNPFWGNPVASPAFPTPSPQSLSPYYGNSHWDNYRSNISMDPDAYRKYIEEYVGGQIDDAIQGGFADEIANATDPMTGCLVNDTRCKAQFWNDQGG